jgi:F-type H+-transporting ATPase subunit b
MTKEIVTHATTQADGSVHGSDHGPTLLGLSGEGWVYVGLTIFILIAIFVAKAPKIIVASLDARIAETRRTLDEARAIRAEAEALLKNAQAQSKASAGDAAAIVENAEVEANLLLADAKKQAAELTARRSRMAEDKIAAAERSAIAEVRAKAASVAANVAAQVIARSHDMKADKSLIDTAIARLN